MLRIITIILFVTVNIHSQLKEFEIKETTAPGSPPVFVNYPDDAALIIYSSIENITFESNIDAIANVRTEAGKYTIVVKTERQFITLKCHGFREGKLSVPKMTARDVKYYTIEAKKTDADKLPVTIMTEPAGAQLYIDGAFSGVAATQMLSPGVHEIKAVKDNYKTTTKTIEVNQTNVFFTIALEKMKVVILEVRSVPDKAKIFIEGIEEGETNDQLFKMPGKYNLKLSKSGYLDYSTTVDVKETGTNVLNAALEKSSVTLRLDISPKDASLKINRKEYLFGNEIELAPGTYQVEVEKMGYDKLEETIVLERGKSVTRRYTLTQQTGSLQLKVKPIDAKVSLVQNGIEKIYWQGSALKELIPVGEYVLAVSAESYIQQSKQIFITKNQLTSETIVLDKVSEVKKNYVNDNISNTEVSNNHDIPNKYSITQMLLSVFLSSGGINTPDYPAYIGMEFGLRVNETKLFIVGGVSTSERIDKTNIKLDNTVYEAEITKSVGMIYLMMKYRIIANDYLVSNLGLSVIYLSEEGETKWPIKQPSLYQLEGYHEIEKSKIIPNLSVEIIIPFSKQKNYQTDLIVRGGLNHYLSIGCIISN